MAKLRSLGAVGDILGHFFDQHGELIPSHYEQRVMSLELDQLKRIPRVMCVAGGLDKVKPIRAALEAELFDTLVTDELVAQALIESEDTKDDSDEVS